MRTFRVRVLKIAVENPAYVTEFSYESSRSRYSVDFRRSSADFESSTTEATA
jgi:hypothetical protein